MTSPEDKIRKALKREALAKVPVSKPKPLPKKLAKLAKAPKKR